MRPRRRLRRVGLSARPAESEHPEMEINHFQEQQRKQPGKKLGPAKNNAFDE
ncbi:hypothetical protein [Fictibacillus sp. FJAT-27399]|uniref:hypothetical protein n=1 Tax=Fictibacillus sp. FJAT-27399 TaxID=1729689 RepID=UPI0012E36E51|nr:hypothetical protein [Fictibacillus sp. FJAT-27399]